MKEITFTEQTMTLKEITDLLNVRHDKAMLKVTAMAKSPDFGTLSILDIVYNDKGQTIETYQLNKRQSIAVSAKLNTTLLMRIIDRWQELEHATQVIADTLNVNKEAMLKDLKLDASIEVTKANIEIAKAKGETAKLKLQALKDKLAKDKTLLEAKTTKLLAQGTKIKADMTVSKLTMPIDNITNLLLSHGSTLTPAETNNTLVRLGFLSLDKTEVTALGSYYGKTVKPSPRAKTSVARWFVSEFSELLPILVANK